MAPSGSAGFAGSALAPGCVPDACFTGFPFFGGWATATAISTAPAAAPHAAAVHFRTRMTPSRCPGVRRTSDAGNSVGGEAGEEEFPGGWIRTTPWNRRLPISDL